MSVVPRNFGQVVDAMAVDIVKSSDFGYTFTSLADYELMKLEQLRGVPVLRSVFGVVKVLT
ncbi:MAG: hypothetical protein LBQ66_02885 [Planctomycetaceae bacterium]|nr:hypothetical protein [Planctomycetaceae bacterium]